MRRDTTPEDFSFEHTHRGSSALVKVSFRDVFGLMNITVKDTRNELLGYIGGLWILENDGKIDFHTATTDNFPRIRGNEIPAARRVIGGTVRQIVTRGLVDLWFSSPTLSPDGEDLYRRYLSSQPDLDVQFSDSRNEFLVARKGNSISI